MRLKFLAALLLIPTLSFGACLSWQPPESAFDGSPLSGKIEQYDVYVGGAADLQTMTKVGTQLANSDESPSTVYQFGADCNTLGLQPHDWACVTATYPEGTSECAFIERNPPGQSKSLKVGK